MEPNKPQKFIPPIALRMIPEAPDPAVDPEAWARWTIDRLEDAEIDEHSKRVQVLIAREQLRVVRAYLAALEDVRTAEQRTSAAADRTEIAAAKAEAARREAEMARDELHANRWITAARETMERALQDAGEQVAEANALRDQALSERARIEAELVRTQLVLAELRLA